MKKILASLLLLLSVSAAVAQTSPNLRQGQVLTPAQWNVLFANKQDTLGYVPLNTGGGTMTGRLVTASVPNGTSAGFNLAPGSMPITPLNGDLWTTSSGLFVQLNGTTVPLSGASSASFTASMPLVVTFPSTGVTNYSCPTCGVTTSPLSQFATTTSAQLRGMVSDETGAGLAVFNGAPTIISPVITTSFTATGLVKNADLVSPTITINSVACTLGSTCAISATAASMTLASTQVIGGATTRVLMDNAGVLGEYAISGTGNVAMTTSPAFTTPSLGVATATTINGLTISATTGGTLGVGNSKSLSVANTLSLAGIDGKTLTVNNSLGLSGTDGTVFTFPVSSDSVVVINAAQNLLNKTLTSPILVTPTLGVAVGTSAALGGCTIGTNALCTAGTATISSSSASALAVGPSGATNPVLQVDASTASQASGLKITGSVTAGVVTLDAIDPNANVNIAINAKGNGQVRIGNVSTGGVLVGSPLIYGGVTLANSVTGTGSMVLSNTPTIVNGIQFTSGSAPAGPSIGLNSANRIALVSASNGGLIVLNNASQTLFYVDNNTGAASFPLGALTMGTAASVAGSVVFSGLTSGSVTLTSSAVASGTLTLPSATDTVAVLALTQTLSNKTLAAPTISGHPTVEGVTSTGATGTGNFVFSGNPSVSNLTVTGAFTATGLVTYAAMAPAAIASTANFLAGSPSVLISPSVIYTTETTTAYAATVTFDFSTFINTAVPMTGNITTQSVANVTAGKAGSITFTQDATGSRTTVWNSVFKFASGVAPSLSSAPNAVDVLFYSCRSATNCPASLVKDIR